VVVLVLDKVLIHRSKLVQAWLRAHPRMRLLYGARYSPHHNPVERIWGLLNRPRIRGLILFLQAWRAM
jgi:transposase